MTYAGSWAYVCGVFGALGDGLAILEWSPLVAGLAVALISCCAAVIMVLTRVSRDPPDTTEASGWARGVTTPSLLAGAGVVALVAVAAGSPPVALLLALLATFTSPPVVLRARRTVVGCAATPAPKLKPKARAQAERGARSRETLHEVLPGDTVEQLSDRELCVLWRRTFWQLTSHQTPDALLATVLLRQACLDELARRNPHAVQAWLESGARASGGPEKFWVTGDPHRGDADAAP